MLLLLATMVESLLLYNIMTDTSQSTVSLYSFWRKYSKKLSYLLFLGYGVLLWLGHRTPKLIRYSNSYV